MLYYLATALKKLKMKKKYPFINTFLVITPEYHQLNNYFPQTPANIDQVSRINELILQFSNQTLNIPRLALFSKLIKAAKLAMADCIVLNAINTKLYKANVWKKR